MAASQSLRNGEYTVFDPDKKPDRPHYADIGNALESAFRTAGYVEYSYYAVPQGFALVSRLKQINTVAAKDASFRWTTTIAAPRVFSGLILFPRAASRCPG